MPTASDRFTDTPKRSPYDKFMHAVITVASIGVALLIVWFVIMMVDTLLTALVIQLPQALASAHT